MMRHIYWLLLLSLLAFGSCKSKKKIVQPTSKVQAPRIVNESFDGFYDRFHTDMEFQLSRIQFPLAGLKVNVSSQEKWSKDNWVPMKTKIYNIGSSEYKTSFDQTETSFYQKIWIEDSGFMSEYRFTKINGKWFLTYAKEVDM